MAGWRDEDSKGAPPCFAEDKEPADFTTFRTRLMMKFTGVVDEHFLRTCAYSLCMYYRDVQEKCPQHPLLGEMLRYASHAQLNDWSQELHKRFVELNVTSLPCSVIANCEQYNVSGASLRKYMDTQNAVHCAMGNRVASIEAKVDEQGKMITQMHSIICAMAAKLGVAVEMEAPSAPVEARSSTELPSFIATTANLTVPEGFVYYYDLAGWDLRSDRKSKHVINLMSTAVKMVKHFLPPGTIIPPRPQLTSEHAAWLAILRDFAESVMPQILSRARELREAKGDPIGRPSASLTGRVKDFGGFDFQYSHVVDQAIPSNRQRT
jgi:hypothetical protein